MAAIEARRGQAGARKAWADLRDSSAEDMSDIQPCKKRMAWADLRDSSAEDLDSQPSVPAPLLHQESYMETPEPSFDHPQGSVILNLRAATALDAPAAQPTAAWRPNAAALAFVPTPTLEIFRSGSFADRLRQKRRQPAALTRNKRSRQAETSSTASVDIAMPLQNNSAVSEAVRPIRSPDLPAAAEASEGLSEEDWQRRNEKRLNLVQSIKTTLEYEKMAEMRDEGHPAPSTPDPQDRQISKRKWESEVMKWRNSLRQYTRADLGL